MTATSDAEIPAGWYPVAARADLVAYHVHQAMLGGKELAVWRADDGHVNVWENRCLHRGVRLTIGTTDGAELKCAYHGWRYANRTAGCTYVPAHPADAPARTICNTTYPAVDRYGLVWSGFGVSGEPPAASWLEDAEPVPLRALPFHAPADVVLPALAQYRFAPFEDPDDEDPRMEVVDEQSSRIVLRSSVGRAESLVVFFVQPVDVGRCIVRGVMGQSPTADRLTAVLRVQNRRLSDLRHFVEAGFDPPEPYVDPALRPPPPRSRLVVEPLGRRQAPVEVRVRRKWPTATDIVAVELEPIAGPLPTAQAGAHIDLHLPNGLVRQYSLTNGPGETDRYRIGVKLEPRSRGGSRYVHETLSEGDELLISSPRPSFPLRRDAVRSVLIAGGIGVTPLLSMAQTLHRNRLPVELHYFARADDHLAFPEILKELGAGVVTHTGLDPRVTGDRLRSVLASPRSSDHLYICGPGPMLEAARNIAADLGWPESTVHFEYFKNTNEIDLSSSFEVSLARSALTLTVPEGRTILEILHEAGVPLASSCEQGACGTCVATVLAGEPDHRDVRLTESEKQRGYRIMTCVSRAKSARLVLDL